MFETGDLIMYGSTGVCRVDAISTQVFGPEDDREYYVLEPLYQSGTIFAPTDNDKVYMRPVISEEEVLDLIDSMPGVPAEIYKCSSIQQLSKHYQSVINAHDCIELIRLTKSIHKKKEEAKKQNRHLGQIDKRFMKKAEDLLFGEIAAVLEIPMDDVQGYIEDRIGNEYYTKE